MCHHGANQNGEEDSPNTEDRRRSLSVVREMCRTLLAPVVLFSAAAASEDVIFLQLRVQFDDD